MTKNKGFVALISAIIIAAVLLGMTLAGSTMQFTARESVLNSELKQISQSLAESCEQITLIQLANNFSYTPPPSGQIFSTGSNSCTILSVTYGAENPLHQKYATTTVSANYHGAQMVLRVQTLLSDPAFAWPPTQKMIDVVSRQ